MSARRISMLLLLMLVFGQAGAATPPLHAGRRRDWKQSKVEIFFIPKDQWMRSGACKGPEYLGPDTGSIRWRAQHKTLFGRRYRPAAVAFGTVRDMPLYYLQDSTGLYTAAVLDDGHVRLGQSRSLESFKDAGFWKQGKTLATMDHIRVDYGNAKGHRTIYAYMLSYLYEHRTGKKYLPALRDLIGPADL